jgi:hypothetical protein
MSEKIEVTYRSDNGSSHQNHQISDSSEPIATSTGEGAIIAVLYVPAWIK